MLYDPKWEHQTKADPLTLESLIAWLERMPPDETYEWMNCSGGCLIGQYGAARGIDNLPSNSDWLRQIFPDYADYSRVCSSLSGPTTFGAALDRARAVAARI